MRSLSFPWRDYRRISSTLHVYVKYAFVSASSSGLAVIVTFGFRDRHRPISWSSRWNWRLQISRSTSGITEEDLGRAAFEQNVEDVRLGTVDEERWLQPSELEERHPTAPRVPTRELAQDVTSRNSASRQ